MKKSENREEAGYPLEDMLRELVRIQDETAWALAYTFSADPIAKAIPGEQAEGLCRKALACGHGQAAETKKRFGSASQEEICRLEQIQILWDLEDRAGGAVRFAEYEEPDRIRINKSCAEQAEQTLREIGEIPGLSEHRVSEVLLAHEYYHCLEYRNPELFTVAYRHRSGRAAFFGPARLVSLREIGAGAFAADMLGYPYASAVYDVLFTYCFSPGGAGRLYARMMDRLAKEKTAPQDQFSSKK